MSDSKSLLPPRPNKLKLKAIGFGEQIDAVNGKRVVVTPVEPYTEMDRLEQSSILHIPESARAANQPRPTSGVVAQIGADVVFVQVGDAVIFSSYAGHTVFIGAIEYRILMEEEILIRLKLPDEANLIEQEVKEG